MLLSVHPLQTKERSTSTTVQPLRSSLVHPSRSDVCAAHILELDVQLHDGTVPVFKWAAQFQNSGNPFRMGMFPEQDLDMGRLTCFAFFAP